MAIKKEKKPLDPKNDYVFKRIFGWEGNEDITGDLISSIIVEKMLTKWRVKEIDDSKITLTDKLEFYILELPKIKENSETSEKLKNWIKFIKSPEDIKMEDLKDKYIKKAMEELEKLGDSEEEQERAFKRELFIMDLKAIEARGIDKGIEQGEKNSKIEIAEKMLKRNIDIKEISEITGLTEEEINNLV